MHIRNLTTFGKTVALALLLLPSVSAAQNLADLGVFPTWQKKPADKQTPRITEKTKVIYTKDSPTVYPVYDGVFAISENGLLSFYEADSVRCISKGKYKSIDSQHESRFSGNSAMVRSTQMKGKYTPYVILHRDGTVKELHPEWTSTCNFADGLACAGWFDHSYLAHNAFIDENGEKVLPAYNFDSQRKLRDNCQVTEVKPISEGLRAFFSRNDRKWGYLDAKGNIAIKPQFTSARAFREGYAAVTVSDANGSNKLGFIDKTGTITFKPAFNANDVETATDISDVTGGMICVYDNQSSTTTYYSPQGQVLKSYKEFKGTPVVDGHIFIQELYNEQKLYVLSSGFKPLREITCDEGYELPHFTTVKEQGVSLARVNAYKLINSDGDVVIAQQEGSFGNFSKDGFCVNTFNVEYETCYGIMRTDGEYSMIIVKEELKDKFKHLKEPEDTKTPPPLENQLYHVNVVCVPPEGGTATGTGDYPYDTVIEVNVKANPGYKYSGLLCDDNQAKVAGSRNKFVVRDSMTIEAHFIKEDSILPPPPPPTEKGGMVGKVGFNYENSELNMHTTDKLDLYMELSATQSVETPYGNRYGFLQIQFDPTKAYPMFLKRGCKEAGVKESNGGTLDMHVYTAPYEILGFMEADGKKWMVIDGGGLKGVPTNIKADFSSNPFAPAQFLAVFLEGFRAVEIEQRAFRIEVTNVDPATGAMTFGKLQTFSPAFGWVPGRDQRLRNFQTKFIMPFTFVTKLDDGGFAENFFEGVVMQPTEKRTIEWTTPKVWFDTLLKKAEQKIDSGAEYEKTKNATLNNYRKFKSCFTQFWEK